MIFLNMCLGMGRKSTQVCLGKPKTLVDRRQSSKQHILKFNTWDGIVIAANGTWTIRYHLKNK